MAAGIVIVLLVPAASKFFDLVVPPGELWVAIVLAVLVAGIAVQFIPVTADGGEVAELPDEFRLSVHQPPTHRSTTPNRMPESRVGDDDRR